MKNKHESPITPHDIRIIKAMRKKGRTTFDLAALFGVSVGTILKVLKKK